MSLRVVGSGLGRTGTMSLKIALEKLLGGKCHHMAEVFPSPEQVKYWTAASRGQMPDWDEVFRGYVACVDWPSSAFWPEISAKYPDAIVLHSTRDSSEAWWKSAHATIFQGIDLAPSGEWRDMVRALFESRFTPRIDDREAAIAAYERHNADVLKRVPKHRLLEYRPGMGWEPLCKALGVPIPNEPYPHENSTEQFLDRMKAIRPPQ